MNYDAELDELLRASERLYCHVSTSIGILWGASEMLKEARALRVRVENMPMEIEQRRFWDMARARNNLRYIRDECLQSDRYIANDLLHGPDEAW